MPLVFPMLTRGETIKGAKHRELTIFQNIDSIHRMFLSFCLSATGRMVASTSRPMRMMIPGKASISSNAVRKLTIQARSRNVPPSGCRARARRCVADDHVRCLSWVTHQFHSSTAYGDPDSSKLSAFAHSSISAPHRTPTDTRRSQSRFESGRVRRDSRRSR